MTDQSRTKVAKRIKEALKRRSGRDWSVTGGRGTASGWITIKAPTNRQVCYCQSRRGEGQACTHEYKCYASKVDETTLHDLLGHEQGRYDGDSVSIPASRTHWNEYIDRAEGRTPIEYGTQYWD